jgi:hypothetical protein
MASRKQRNAAKRNVKKAQAGAKRKQALESLPEQAKAALDKDGSRARGGAERSRQEYFAEVQRRGVSGRSKVGRADLKRAVQRHQSR